uniref:Uncharacterized protein n=1 Tax=Acrobeloides nanus TaxID=290746 RepID=A0A914CL88_9BILA
MIVRVVRGQALSVSFDVRLDRGQALSVPLVVRGQALSVLSTDKPCPSFDCPCCPAVINRMSGHGYPSVVRTKGASLVASY